MTVFLVGLGLGLAVAGLAARWAYRFGHVAGRRQEILEQKARLEEAVLASDESHNISRDDSRDSVLRRTTRDEGPTTC